MDTELIEYIDENNAVDSIHCGEMIGIHPFFILKASRLSNIRMKKSYCLYRMIAFLY